MRDRSASAAPDSFRVRRSAFAGGEPNPLPLRFYDRPAEEVARDLLGARVLSTVGGEPCGGEIVETEAYVGPHDESSHAHIRFGRTERNGVMFGPPGHAYVYRIYGIHWCLNAVTGAEGFPAAVLIRALRPLVGAEVARERRAGRAEVEWMRGPGNLSRALGVSGVLNGHPLDRAPLWIEPGDPVPDARVKRGPRIGITRAADWPLRFWIAGDRYVSAKR